MLVEVLILVLLRMLGVDADPPLLTCAEPEDEESDAVIAPDPVDIDGSYVILVILPSLQIYDQQELLYHLTNPRRDTTFLNSSPIKSCTHRTKLCIVWNTCSSATPGRVLPIELICTNCMKFSRFYPLALLDSDPSSD